LVAYPYYFISTLSTLNFAMDEARRG
jgi:hypothetical protein